MARPVGGIRSPIGTLIPIYCANCGVEWGKVPEEHITFAFALCNPCAEKHGDIAHTYKEPDEVFWRRVHDAQLEESGRLLTAAELTKELDDGSSLMSKLADEWRTWAASKGR